MRLAVPIVPMLSDYFLTTSPLSMTEEERANLAGMRASWKALAQVMDGQCLVLITLEENVFSTVFFSHKVLPKST